MPRDIENNPNYRKVIIIDENGFYELNQEVWKKDEHKLKDEGAHATVGLLKEAGSYLSFVDPEIASGAGMACTVVNLAALLREVKAR